MEPPAPPGRRKCVQYIRIRVVRDPVKARKCEPRHNRQTASLHSLAWPSSSAAAIAAVSPRGLTAFVPGRPVTAPCDTGPWTALVRDPSHALSRDAAGGRLQAAAPGHPRQRACHAVARHGGAVARAGDRHACRPGRPSHWSTRWEREAASRGSTCVRSSPSDGIPDSLLNAFVRTAQEATRDTAQLACALEAVRQMTASRDNQLARQTASIDCSGRRGPQDIRRCITATRSRRPTIPPIASSR